MGCAFGARLGEAGHDVLLVDVSLPLVSAIQTRGVRLVEGQEERSVRLRATADPCEEPRADAVVFFVKHYHTASAAQLAAPLVADETTVASLQNGWGNEAILAEAFGAERVVAGVTYHSATVVEPGRIAHTGEGPTFLGPFDGGGLARAEALADALRSPGFVVEAIEHVQAEIWKKLVLNAAVLPVAALTRLSAGAMVEIAPLLELVDGIAREALEVALAAGLQLDLDERLTAIHATLERAGSGKPSMLQDVEAQRRTEVEAITGAVVREGDRLGVDAPLNRALYALVGGLEQGLRLR